MSEEMKAAAADPVKTERRKKRKKQLRRIRRVILIVLLLLVLAVGGLLVYSQMPAKATVTYDRYTASVGTISNSLSFSGSLQLIDNATYTASAASTVRTVYVAEGAQVKKGDKLVRLSNGQTVEAGFDGRVNQLYVTVGDEVSNGASLVQVADFSRMKVSIRVDEYDISDVSVGQSCRVTATATEKTLESSIASINYISSSSGNVAYYTATAYVDVPEGLYPGMQVTVSIPQEEAQNVVLLNVDALSFDQTNQAYVLMEDSTGAMQNVYVTTGVSNGNYVEITGGLRSGDTVYKVAETKASSTSLLSGLSSLFGGGQQNMRMPSGGGADFFGQGGGGGSMPSFDRQNNGGGSRGGSSR